MADEFKRTLEVNVNTNVNTNKILEAERIINRFFDKYDGESLDLGIDMKKAKIDVTEFTRMIMKAKELSEEIELVKTNAPSMLPSIKKDMEYLEKIKTELSSVFAVFNDGSTASGFDEVMSKVANGFSVAAADIGGRVEHLRSQISGAVEQLKELGAVKKTWRGNEFDQISGDLSESELSERIELLKKIVSYQKELEVFFNTEFDMKNAPLGAYTSTAEADVKRLERLLGEMRGYNEEVDEQHKLTVKQFRQRKQILNELRLTEWGTSRQKDAIRNISDEEEYEENIRSLNEYIQKKRTAISQLESLRHELFRADDVSELLSDARKHLSQYEGWLQELQTKKNGGIGGAVANVDLSGVIQQLEEIRNAINGIRTAFEPLTNALSSEDSALHRMLSTSIDDLNALTSRLGEVYQMIDAISNKKFNVTNVLSGGNSQQADIEQIRQFRQEAKLLFAQVEELYNEHKITGNQIKGMPGGIDAILNFSNAMSEFDLTDLAKRIKSRSAASLGIVIDELNEWKRVLLQFNNLRNNIEAGSFNVSKYADTSSRVSIGSKTADKDERAIVDSSTVDNEDILNKVKTLSNQIETELTAIRTKIVETFDFSTINPNIEHVNNIVDAIYKQFVELQNKINALDIKIPLPTVTNTANVGDTVDVSANSAKNVNDAADAIEREGEAARIAAKSKGEFVDANKQVAQSGSQTKNGLAGATDAIEAEGRAAQNFADEIEDSTKRAQASISRLQVSQERIISEFKKSGLSGKVNDTISDNFNKAIANAGVDASSIASTFSVKSAVGEDGERYLYNVIKLVASGNDEFGKAVNIIREYNVATGELLSTQTRFKDAKDNFDLAATLETAKSKLDELKTRMGAFRVDITAVTDAFGNINDEASFNVFVDRLKDAEQKVSEIKAMLKSSRSLDPLTNAEKQMSTLDTVIETYRKNIEKFSNVEGFEELKAILDGVHAKIQEFNSESDGLAKAGIVRQINQDIDKFNAKLGLVKATARAVSEEKKELADILSLQERLYNLKKQLAKVDAGSAKGQELSRRINELQEQYDASEELLGNEEKLASVKKREIQLEKELAAVRKQAQNSYGKSVYNKELREYEKLDAKMRDIYGAGINDSEDEQGKRFSGKLLETVREYKKAFAEFERLRTQFIENPEAFNDGKLKAEFQGAALAVEQLRGEMTSAVKVSKELQNISPESFIGSKQLDATQIDSARASMIEFAASVTNGQMKLEGFNDAGTEMYGTLDQGAGVVQKVTIALDKSTNTLYAYKNGTKQVSNSWEKLGNSLKSGISRLAVMYLSFYDIIRYVRRGLEYVKEIDLAMTELKKVTNETDETYKRFLKTASDTASVIGSTVSDFTDATAAFARLGYSINESAKMAETAIVYKNVADGLDGVEESTESIISTMMAYGIEANDTMRIIDRFNAVGNSFAITSAGIGEALQRSASALYSAGNTIDESVALVTTANSVIQNPEQVGTALKTLALRLRGAKTELEEAGLETDNMAESTSTLQAKLKALTHGKVDIMLDADTFKSTTQILREMSAAWEYMTDIERAAAIELMGGKRQANILSSVISNFETVESVIETSMNSQGSALAENAKWLDSIEGKTYQFTNALETMWSNMVDSEMIKTFVGFGTKVIQFLDTLPGKIIAVLAAIAGISKLKGFDIFGLGKDTLSSFSNLGSVQSRLDLLKSNGILPTENIQAYASAVSSLTAKQQANMLVSAGLSKSQVKLAMTTNGLKQDVVEEATAHILSKKSKEDNIRSTQQLIEYKLRQSVITLKETNNTNALAVAEFFEAEASRLATAEDAKQIINTSHLTEKQKELALQLYETAGATGSLKTSFIGLKNTNPSMIITTIAMVLPMIISGIKNLIDTTDDLVESYNNLQDSISSSKTEIDSIESELKTIQDQIDDLSNKNLTITEAEELQRLKAQSAELEKQKELQESILTARNNQNQVKSLSMINNLLKTTAANQEKSAKAGEKWGKGIGAVLGAALAVGAVFATAGAAAPALATVISAAMAGGMAGGALGEPIGKWAGELGTKTDGSLIAWYESYEKAITEAEAQAAEAERKYMNDVTDENYENWRKKVEAVNTLQQEMYNGLEEMQGYINNLEYNDQTKAAIDEFNNLMTHISVASMDGDVPAQISTIESLRAEYEALSRGVDENGKNVALSAEEYARYRAIINQILTYTPSLIQGYDAEGNAILGAADAQYTYNELLEKSIELLKEQRKQAATDIISEESLSEVINNSKERYNSILNQGDSLDKNIIPEEVSRKNSYFSWDIGESRKILEDTLGESGVSNGWFIGYNTFVRENAHLISESRQSITQDLVNAMKDEGVSESDIEKYVTQYNAWLDSLIDPILDAEKAINESIRERLYVAPQASDYYNELSGSQMSFINSYIASLQDLKDKTANEVYDIANEIVDITNLIGSDPNGNLQDAINKLIELDPSSMPVTTYQKKFNELWDRVKEIIPEESQVALYEHLFPDEDQIDTMIAKVKEKVEKASRGLVGGLSLEELRIAFRILPELDEDITFQELRDKIQELMGGLDGPITQTYSTLTEQVEKFKESVKQTSEVILDNTKVTQEYKDSLVELGVSEEDLEDCFDSTNKLVVKNSKKLNELVQNTKKSTAQNIKLAKSQSKLEYYKKYQELKKLTNGQNVTTAATLSQVKALYEEMTALQKTISRYSMLEHQLLGATNAYEDFAKAQEIDSANDYETKAEELVGYLVDAFHTGKLGAESAQAAIKGLVPESVYADLDTLDEKMDEVYKYFTTDLSKYFYVKFNDDGSLESAEMLIDNVKKFVEDGIVNGVFTGSWEEWDVDPTINSLDELAEKMNVTKEVAYAFLQAMETYDISWIGGDASTLLDRLLPNSEEIVAFGNQLQDRLKNTSVDIKVQPKLTANELVDAGWTDDANQAFEVADYVDSDGSYVNLTPVLPNGKVVDKETFDEYVQSQLNSGGSLKELTIDGYKVYVGSYDTKEAAEAAAKQLESDIKDYQNMVASYSLENEIYSNTQKRADLEYKIGAGAIKSDTIVGEDGKTTAAEELDRLNAEAEENAKAARENAAAWTEAKKKYDEASEAVNDLNEKLEDAISSDDEERVKALTSQLDGAKNTLWDTYAALVKCGEPTEVILTIAMEQVQKDLKSVKDTLTGTELDIVSQLDIANLEKDANGDWIVNLDAYSNLDDASKAKVQEYIDYLAEEHNINILQGEGAVTTLDVLNEIKDILAQTYDLFVVAKVDDSPVMTWWEEFSKAPWYKKISMIVDKVFGGNDTDTPNTAPSTKTNGKGGVGVNGTAHANGSWGAPKTETALVGELGPELLVRDGRWTTVGDNGAEFTQIRRGDIIFNHKQTKDLLSKGYVAGRGKLNGSHPAFASGTAYAVHPYIDGMKIGKKWQNIPIPLWDNATNGEYLKGEAGDTGGALGDVADAANDFAESLDWIEIRIEELDEVIGLLSAELENAIGYAEKNNKINQIIAKNEEKRKTASDGAAYYEKYAQQYYSKIDSQYQEFAKNGTISITDFAGEASEATVEAIQKYRDYIQKAADLRQQEEEILAEIRDLAKQAFDNVVNDFENQISLNDSKLNRFESENSLLETDKGWASEDIYTEMQKENAAKIEILKQQRDAMQAELDTGKIKWGTDAWYEAVNAIVEVDTEIVNLNTEIEDLQDSINDLNWEQFEFLITQFQAVADEAENLLDILATKDAVDEFGNWTDDGITSLGLLAQQMEVAEKQVSKYEAAIKYLNENWEKLGYTQEEYVDRLEELKSGQYDAIKSYNESKDAILDLNKARVDAIKNGIEKEIDAYEELIKTKKEALDAEKDLHDFQKGVMEQQKNIADIERKLAALSGDNSASARAQRAKLEAELYEAKADLEETYYDRSVSNQQDALDKELEGFQKQKEEEIEGWEKYLENLEVVVADSLAVVQENTGAVLATLTAMQDQYGLAITNSILAPWKAGETAIQEYGAKLNVSLTTLAAMFGLTVDEFAAKLGLTTDQLVSNLDITVAQMAANLKLTNEQLAAQLGLTVTDLNSKMNMTIQQLAASMGLTLPALAEKLGTTTAGLAGNLDMTMSQFAGKMGITVESLASKFGLSAQGLADKLGMTYQDLMNPFGLSMSATVDALKALETEYSNILNGIKGDSQITIDEVNKAMQKYEDAKDKQQQQQQQEPQKPSEAPAQQPKPQSTSVGSRINAGNARIYADSYGGGGGKQYFASDPNYIVLSENNGYVLVRHHKLNSGYTGWFKKSELPKFASGTLGTKKDGLAILDELGDELRLIPGKNGRLEYVKKGTGIIPADMTENLMSWGALDPQDMLDRNRPTIGASHLVHNEVNINMNIAEVVHVDHVDHDTLPDLTKAVRKEMDSYMTKVNNAIRSKVR